MMSVAFLVLCAADSDLSAIVEWHAIWMFLTASLCLHTCLSVWLNVVGSKRTLFSSKPLPGLISCLTQLRGSEDTDNTESTLQSLKRLKQGMPLAVNELWDDHNGNFVDDTACMAKLIQDAAQDRQGRVTWYANFSQCRVIVERHEIVNIILESPNCKKPGPDGLPAAFLKRYCHQLAIIFQEAWIVLASGRAPIDHVRMCLGVKKWIVAPIMEGANTIDK